MKNTEYNQTLIKKAQAGLLRFQGMQKKAIQGLILPGSVNDPDFLPETTTMTTNTDSMPKEQKEHFGLGDKPTNPYLRYAAGGAGVGALVGALVNLVRNKSLLSGALGGALVGGGLGAGHQALRDKVEGYADKNPIDPWISKGQEAWGNLKSKFNA